MTEILSLVTPLVTVVQGRVSHFIFLRESRFYGSGVLAKVWDAEMREFYAGHNLVELWDVNT